MLREGITIVSPRRVAIYTNVYSENALADAASCKPSKTAAPPGWLTAHDISYGNITAQLGSAALYAGAIPAHTSAPHPLSAALATVIAHLFFVSQAFGFYTGLFGVQAAFCAIQAIHVRGSHLRMSRFKLLTGQLQQHMRATL